LGGLSDKFSEDFVLFLEGLENVPNFFEIRSGDCLFNRLPGPLLQIEGNEDVADFLAC
jgi:hypothetical protein